MTARERPKLRDAELIPRLRGFLALASHLSFRRAAAELGISQPALSGQIKSLERHLDLKLFSRTTRRVGLTEEGERCLVRARRLIRDLDGAVDEMKSPMVAPGGTVSFACIPSIVLHLFPRLLREFSRRNPGIKVEVTDDATVSMERRLVARELDLGIGGPPQAIDDLEFLPVVDDPFVFVCRADHPLARQSKVSVRRALEDPLISLSRDSNVYTTLCAHLSRTGHPFAPAYEVLHHYSAFSMVDAGMGVTILPSMACEMIKVPSRLRTLRLADPSFTRPVGILKLRGSALAHSAKDLCQLAVKILREDQISRSPSARRRR